MGNSLIKLTQRNRSTNNGSNNNQNRAQNNDSQNLLSSPILNLNGHCFDEIFEYLSLEDLTLMLFYSCYKVIINIVFFVINF